MSRPGQTQKPCEGCGATGGRATGEVCRDCAALLKLGRTAREQLEVAAAAQVRVFRHCTEAYYELPYIHNAHVPMRASDPDDDFRRAVLALVERLSARVEWTDAPHAWRDLPYHEQPRLLPRPEGFSFRVIRSFQAGDPELVERLWHASVAMVAAAYDNGKRDGRNLLAGLASGEVSVGDYNRETADADTREARQ